MRLESHLHTRGWRSSIVKLLNPAHQKDVWDVRKAGLNILMGRRGDYKPVPGIEDVSVPQEKLADYLQKILDFCGEQEDVARHRRLRPCLCRLPACAPTPQSQESDRYRHAACSRRACL